MVAPRGKDGDTTTAMLEPLEYSAGSSSSSNTATTSPILSLHNVHDTNDWHAFVLEGRLSTTIGMMLTLALLLGLHLLRTEEVQAEAAAVVNVKDKKVKKARTMGRRRSSIALYVVVASLLGASSVLASKSLTVYMGVY